MNSLKTTGLIIVGSIILYGGYYSATHSIDFQTYYRVGAQILRHDFDLYPQQLHALGEARTGLYFRYAPVTALLFVPFALFSMEVAAFLFYLMKVAALYYIVVMIMRLTGVGNDSFGKICGIAFVAGGGFLVEEFRSGNVHFLTFFLIVLALYLIDKGRTTLPSFLLGLVIAIKITPILFLLYFAVKRRFKICLQIMSSLALLFLAPALIIGFQGNTLLLQQWASSALEQKDAAMNHSLKGVMFKYLNENDIDGPKYGRINFANFDRQSVSKAWSILAAALVIALTVILIKPNTDTDRRWLEYSLVTVAILLLSPHTNRLYFCTLFLPYCVLVALQVKYQNNHYSSLIKGVLGLCFLTNTLAPLIMPGRNAALAYENHAPYFFTTFILFLVLSCLIYGFEKFKTSSLTANPGLKT